MTSNDCHKFVRSESDTVTKRKPVYTRVYACYLYAYIHHRHALEHFIFCVNRRIPAYILHKLFVYDCRTGQLMMSQSLGGDMTRRCQF